jgi:hypothetical protein
MSKHPDIQRLFYRDGFGQWSSPFGPVSSGRGLKDVVIISIWVVAHCAVRRLPVCEHAQESLPAGTGYVTRDGMFILENESKRVVYELFPAEFPDGQLIYLGVKREES